jgi:hypothetical protein
MNGTSRFSNQFREGIEVTYKGEVTNKTGQTTFSTKLKFENQTWYLYDICVSNKIH